MQYSNSELKLVINETLTELGLIKPTMTQAEAFRIYGRVTVERWASEGQIRKIRKQNRVHYLRSELISMSISNHFKL